jgi:hypothetical protein
MLALGEIEGMATLVECSTEIDAHNTIQRYHIMCKVCLDVQGIPECVKKLESSCTEDPWGM